MEDTNRVYRIRTVVGEEAPNVIHVPLKQSYDMFEILSLKLDQTNTYKTYDSDYGVIVGRVTANGGFGIPNAKVSIFIEVSEDESLKNRFLYNFTSVTSTDYDGVRYNVLPDFVDDACHQDVGTFPNKRLVLDNQDIIEIFDKYWKYTTTTNHAGDYMLFGIPTGSQQLHVDVDLSDCGILSQRPRDMIGKGYNENMFESPNKFKYSTNLNSLAQIVSQDKGVYVYPYWGDVADGDDKFSITRCDINLEYKFESYAVFIGSIVTDKGSNAIGKNCAGTEQNGKMSDLIAGEGTIEMIRKTLDNKVEEFPIMGNRLIDGDGVWCYQIPMNLDYVTTDEFGNLVPTDNPEKGIATRTRVRFRISLDENPNDATARKRARYLVPNNPRIGDKEFTEELEADYEFGSLTRDESYCDMFWNKVYTVKNYIPKLQKNSKETNRKHTGIKLINHYGDNNPMPYNALTIKLSFTYRLICVIVKVFIFLVKFLNIIISILGAIPCWLAGIKIWKWRPFKKVMKFVPSCIALSSEFCDDGINPNIYYPGCTGCVWNKKTKHDCQQEQAGEAKEDQKKCINKEGQLYTCVENELAQQNDATSFNFYNDWVNGVLYAPLWYRKIRPKKRFFFGLFRRKAKDEWCSAKKNFDTLRIMHACSVVFDENTTKHYKNFDGDEITPNFSIDDSKQTKQCKKKECNKSKVHVKGMYGVILDKETMLGQTVYYYKALEYDPSLTPNKHLFIQNKPAGEIKLLFATDIVLLGSLNDCDMNGIPQFFKSLESTTYNLPTDILFTDHDIQNELDANGNFVEATYTETSEMAGCDWGNKNEYGEYDGGLFYSIGCSDIEMTTKSCINLKRICEYGVSLDETKQVAKLSDLETKGDEAFEDLITDGFVSWDELYNLDERSMFATMNGNRLKTKLNTTNGLYEYDFRYLYPENFEGSLKNVMEQKTKKYKSNITYRNNYKLEEFSRDYYIFRMGNNPYFYDSKEFEVKRSFPRYENSFYFYFGLKAGKTAIEKFNSKYFAECVNPNAIESQIGVKSQANSWCSQLEGNENDGYVAFDFSRISAPYDLLINGVTHSDFSFEIKGLEEEKIYISAEQVEKLEQKDYKQLKINAQGEYDADNGTPVPMFDNGSYLGNIVDSDGNIAEFRFTIEGKYITFKTEVQHFKQPNNVLGDDYAAIAQNGEGKALNQETNQVTRDIGGVITISNVYINGEKVNTYRVEVRPEKPLNNYDGANFNNQGSKTNDVIHYDNNNEIYGVGVGKGDVVYVVTVIETCDGIDSDNIVTTKILVEEPMPFKMFINDIDYDLIKNFNKIGNVYTSGWTPGGTIKRPNPQMQDVSGRNVIYDNNPWFNIDNIWSNVAFKPIDELQTIDDIKVEKTISTTTETWTNAAGETKNARQEDLVDGPIIVEDYIYGGLNGFITKVNDKTLEIVNPGVPTKITLTSGSTWRDFNGEIHTATQEDVDGERVVDDYEDYGTFTLQSLIDEFTTPTVSGVYYTWDGDYYLKEYNADTFNASTAQYNEDNIYDLISLVNEFIDAVNEAIMLRKELPSLMRSAFYLTCNNEEKVVSISVQTSDMPYKTTLVYQEESALEDESQDTVNTLTTNNMVKNYDSFIDNINIPTITYACNERYGVEGRTDYGPVVAQVKNGKKYYQKHAFYVGTANDVPKTIPKDLNTKKVNDIWQIDEGVALEKLFDFPLIDMVLNINFMAWAFFNEIPYYRKPKKRIISYSLKATASIDIRDFWAAEQGIEDYSNLSPFIVAGYEKIDKTSIISIGEYEELNHQSDILYYVLLENEETHISTEVYDTLNASQKELYEPVFKNEIYMPISEADLYEPEYDPYYYILKTDSSQTKTIEEYDNLSSDDKELWEIAYDLGDITMNGSFAANVFNGGFVNNKLDTQTLCGLSLKFSKNLINGGTYVEKRIVLGYEGDEVLRGMLGFTNYIVDDKYERDVTQYAPVLPMESSLRLEDESGCSIDNTIYGNMSVELTDDAVNDCIKNQNILDLSLNGGPENATYFVFSLRDNTYTYPLNYAELKTFIEVGDGSQEDYGLYKLDNEIKGIYDQGKEYNMFSYLMTTDSFLNGGFIDTRYGSQISEERDDGSVKTTNTNGYGNTGHFEYKIPFYEDYKDYDPIFVVAITENNCRTISPVYDYSYVGGLIKYGTVERKEVEITTEGGGEGSTSGSGEQSYEVQETVKDYKFGIAVKEGHYYLDHYKYKLSGVCKFDSVNRIDVEEDTMVDSEQFLFTTITEAMFKQIKAKFKKKNLLQEVIKNTSITAIDYTGLKHICGIDADEIDGNPTTWYTYIWIGNLPLDENNNEYEASQENGGISYKGDWYNYIEFIYEKGQEIDIMQGVAGTTLQIDFLGWTENEPNKNGPFVDFSGDNLKASECRVFFGNWDIPTPMATVHFLDCNETELYSVNVEMNGYILPSSEYSEYQWYLSTDETQTPVDFGTDGYGPITTETTFIHICEINVDWIDDTDAENPTNIVEPPIYNVHFRDSETATQDLFTRQVQLGELVEADEEGYEEDMWYVMGDTTKTSVVFPYIVTDEITFIRKRKYLVKWVDNGEIYGEQPVTPPVSDVYIFVNEGSETYTLDATITQLPQIIILSSHNGQWQTFDSAIEDGAETWISFGSSNVSGLTCEEHRYLQIRNNTTGQERRGTILLTQRGSNNTITITIIQRG